ncbi:MAG: hypothetical protein Q8L14_22220, partial [Myxococcales bacterium]|nr:hypothetical protein [Myxococcales bacterium]
MLSLLVVTALAQLDAGAAVDSAEPEISALPADAPVAEAPLATEPVVVAETKAPTAGFVKGELSVYLGSDRLVVKNNRIGLSAGLDRFETAF